MTAVHTVPGCVALIPLTMEYGAFRIPLGHLSTPTFQSSISIDLLAVGLADTLGGVEARGLAGSRLARASPASNARGVVGVAKAATASLKVLAVGVFGSGHGGGDSGEGHDGNKELLDDV